MFTRVKSFVETKTSLAQQLLSDISIKTSLNNITTTAVTSTITSQGKVSGNVTGPVCCSNQTPVDHFPRNIVSHNPCTATPLSSTTNSEVKVTKVSTSQNYPTLPFVGSTTNHTVFSKVNTKVVIPATSVVTQPAIVSTPTSSPSSVLDSPTLVFNPSFSLSVTPKEPQRVMQTVLQQPKSSLNSTPTVSTAHTTASVTQAVTCVLGCFFCPRKIDFCSDHGLRLHTGAY